MVLSVGRTGICSQAPSGGFGCGSGQAPSSLTQYSAGGIRGVVVGEGEVLVMDPCKVVATRLMGTVRGMLKKYLGRNGFGYDPMPTRGKERHTATKLQVRLGLQLHE